MIELKESLHSDLERWPRDNLIKLWRRDLRPGDHVDIEASLFRQKLKKVPDGWIEGRIVSVDKDGSELLIQANCWPPEISVYVSSTSKSVQPLYSHGVPWRLSLESGMSIDIQLSKTLWVIGKIASAENDNLYIEVGIEKGIFKKLSRFSDQISPLGTHTATGNSVDLTINIDSTKTDTHKFHPSHRSGS